MRKEEEEEERKSNFRTGCILYLVCDTRKIYGFNIKNMFDVVVPIYVHIKSKNKYIKKNLRHRMNGGWIRGGRETDDDGKEEKAAGGSSEQKSSARRENE